MKKILLIIFSLIFSLMLLLIFYVNYNNSIKIFIKLGKDYIVSKQNVEKNNKEMIEIEKKIALMEKELLDINMAEMNSLPNIIDRCIQKSSHIKEKDIAQKEAEKCVNDESLKANEYFQNSNK